MADIQDNKPDSREKKIQVAIRVRPVIPREREAEESRELWEIEDSKTIRRKDAKNPKDFFQYDRVFNSNESNLDVYNDICKPIIKEVIKGFNATIFAYGQTSSGKTFTMMGDEVVQGVIHYAIADIFEMIQNMTDREFLLRVSALEIYNEKVYDLLSEKKEDLPLKNDSYQVLNIIGLEERIVQTSDQIWELMTKGQVRRHTGGTQMNEHSSRSHFIFRMIVESSLKHEEDPIVNVSHLNLVDLAGSENVKQTKSTGDRLREGKNINKSLSMLTQVIKELSEEKQQFIVYRNSKLTRILQNSLGGNAHTAIICTVTPISSYETLSTLNFASSAIKIKNKPQKNEIITDQALLKQYANKIKKLSEELKATKEQGELELEEKKKQNERLKKQIEKLKANFVCQSPENQIKFSRRETWGGLLDRRKFLNIRNSASKQVQNLQLPNIYEEENEGESPDLMDFMKNRNSRGTSRSSISSVSSVCLSKNSQKDMGVQTNIEFFEENEDIDELIAMVSDLKSQLTELKNEFAEQVEYTTLEKQILKAEHELQVENEELKTENSILKRKLGLKSSFEKSNLTSFLEFKETESNLSKNESFVNNNNKLEMLKNSEFSDKIDNSHVNRKYDSNKSVKEISQINISSSTLLDDSHEQSNFLSLYNECIEDEVISKFKSEIEALKHDVEIKNKQLNLLHDKIFIKDQFIASLQDEISLNKNNSSGDDTKGKILQVDEICQTMNDINISSTKSTCDTNVKCVTEDKFTEVTPIKFKDFSTQYYKNEITDENFVQTSPIRDLNWFSECMLNVNLKVDQYSQVTDSFLERTSDTDTKERKPVELFQQASQTSSVSIIDIEVFTDNSFSITKEIDTCRCSCFTDETNILFKKVNDLKQSACSILKKCTKTEYLKNADEYLSDSDDCSKSVLQKIRDVENLMSVLEYYICNRDQDCEIINNQLESKFQEVNSLDSELSEVKHALNLKESELSSLSNLFFDLKQSFSQLTFICQALNNVDSAEELSRVKERANIPIPSQSYNLEYEMTMFKNYFAKLNSYIEQNALKMISLSDDLKKVKSELAVAESEYFKSFQSCSTTKNTVTKSVQTSHDLYATDTTEKDKLLTELSKERNALLEKISYLEEKNKGLMKDIDDLYNSEYEKIETLKSELANSWNIKTEQLIKSLEQKYEKELIDQEKNFAEELHAKILEIKQSNLNQIHELNEEIEKIKLFHNRELSSVTKQYEDKLASIDSEKQSLKHQLESEFERKITIFKEKYIAKQKEFRKIYSQLNLRMQHYMEEIEKLKNENTPSNQINVIEKLKEKINELHDEKDLFLKKYTRADMQISELKEHNNFLKHELKKINEEESNQALQKISKLEETNKELLYDLDQKNAKILTLQSNNASMLQEIKKLKDIQSSKASVPCKCKMNAKGLNLDDDKKDRKNKINCKDDLDDQGKITSKQKLAGENSTPQHNDHLNIQTPVQNAVLYAGGGSGPANEVKVFWLERLVRKKDKEMQKLKEEMEDLKFQLKSKKLQPVIKEEKQLGIKQKEFIKAEVTRTPKSPLKEVDENVTVQLKTLHPYHGGAVPKIPKKHAFKEKNGLTCGKPYDKYPNMERKKKENIVQDCEHPVSSNVHKHEIKTSQDVLDAMTNPECAHQ